MFDATRRMLMFGAGASLVATRATAGEPTLRDDGYFEIWEDIGPSVAVIRQAKPFHLQPIGNVTVIEQTDGLVLVDSGGSPGSGRRIAGLIRVNRPGKPVKAIILTHWHGDHPLGLGAILEAWPNARTISTETTKAHLSAPKTMNTPGKPDAKANADMVARFEGFAGFCAKQAAEATEPTAKAGWAAGARLFPQYARDMDGALTLAPQEGFAERLVIDDADAPVEALFLGRAATDGDAVVHAPKQKLVASGDLLVAPIPFGYGSYPREWVATSRRMRALEPAVIVPGHGAPMRSPAYCLMVETAVGAVCDRVDRLIHAGRDAKQTRAELEFNDIARLFTREDPWMRTWFDRYFIDPLVASAWREAKGLPIVQSLG